MKRSTKILFIVASALVILGATIFLTAMVTNNWDWSKLSTMKYETNTHEINEKFNGISINTDAVDLVFMPSEDGICKVICRETEKAKHSVTVVDGNLEVRLDDTRKWYERIAILFFESPQITVYIPQGEYGSLCINNNTGDVDIPKDFKFENIDINVNTGDVKCGASAIGLVKIKGDTGDVAIEGVSAGEIDLGVSTGKITANGVSCAGEMKVCVDTGKTYFDGVTCQRFSSNGNTGDIYLKNVIASESMSIVRDTGDVNFDGSDAGNISVNTETGDVKGTLLSEKLFLVNTTTGKVDVPQTTNGGICKIITDTGRVKIEIAN